MIQDFADWLVYGLFGLSADTPIGVAVNFFFYDTIKILILLFFISVLMGIINAYFPIERLRNYLVTHKMYGLQYLLASIFGAITPFCSCSSIPLFIGLLLRKSKPTRSEEHTSELQSRFDLVCRLLLEK